MTSSEIVFSIICAVPQIVPLFLLPNRLTNKTKHLLIIIIVLPIIVSLLTTNASVKGLVIIIIAIFSLIIGIKNHSKAIGIYGLIILLLIAILFLYIEYAIPADA